MNKIALLNVAVCCLSISTTLSSMSKMPRDFNERLSGDSFAQIARDMVLPEKVLRACTWIDNNKAEMLLRKIFSVKVINDDKQKKLLKFFTLLGRLSEDLFSKEMTYKQATKHLYDLCQQLHEMVNKKLLPSRQYNQNKICLHKMICRLNAIVLKHIKILVALLHLGFTEDDAINFVNFWKNPNRHDSYYCANECWQEFLRNQIKRDRKDACCWDMAKNCWKSEAKIFICENCLVTKIFEELLKKELREYALK